jgi:hypothetical protein
MIVSALKDEELLAACKPLMVMSNWECLEELIRRKQKAQYTRAMSLSDPIEIYRSQGRVHGYDSILSLKSEAKTL